MDHAYACIDCRIDQKLVTACPLCIHSKRFPAAVPVNSIAKTHGSVSTVQALRGNRQLDGKASAVICVDWHKRTYSYAATGLSILWFTSYIRSCESPLSLSHPAATASSSIQFSTSSSSLLRFFHQSFAKASLSSHTLSKLSKLLQFPPNQQDAFRQERPRLRGHPRHWCSCPVPIWLHPIHQG